MIDFSPNGGMFKGCHQVDPSAWAAREPDMAERLHQDLQAGQFQPLVGSWFILEAEGTPALEVVMKQVTTHRSPGMEGFSLIFQGPASPVLPRGTYRARNLEFGECSLFLVPVRTGTIYQALFNHRVTVPLAAGRALPRPATS